MCGIAGLIDVSGSIGEPKDVLRSMGDSLAHRGPDGRGEWFDASARVGLAHRRLSIIDLSPSGAQPMESHCGRWVAVFNGEIYNHLELRRELEGVTPIAWRGSSDTEVLIAAISAWGVARALERLNGMFAIALWDRRERCLHLLRDRFGEKPIYYGWSNGVFVFASELKALRANPGWAPSLDPDAIGELMRFAYIPAPFSIYHGIFKQEPGTWLQVPVSIQVGENPRIQKYWRPFDAIKSAQSLGVIEDPQVACDLLHSVLQGAVRRRMQSDVPLGAFLSGGIDSSIVTALMQANSTRRIRTFSIGLQDDEGDESSFARAVAGRLGTDHTEFIVTSKDALDVIPELPRIYDEPFADSSQIPTLLVSRLARAHVTVALSGDGGDELLGGYNRHVVGPALWRRIGRVPGPFRSLLARLLLTVPVRSWDGVGRVAVPSGFRHKMFGHKIHKYARVLGANSEQDFYRRLASFWHDPAAVVPGARSRPVALLDEAFWPHGLGLDEAMMAMDTVTYMPDDILVKVDRATMAASLEGRIPFLDPHVFEAAWRISPALKIQKGAGKWILRQVLYRYVSKGLVDRPKSGFGIPIGEWLRGPLRVWASDLLSESALRRVGVLDSAAIGRMWAQHLVGTDGLEFHLWNALTFQAWSAAVGD